MKLQEVLQALVAEVEDRIRSSEESARNGVVEPVSPYYRFLLNGLEVRFLIGDPEDFLISPKSQFLNCDFTDSQGDEVDLEIAADGEVVLRYLEVAA